MKLSELQIRNFYCIDDKGVNVKIDNIVVLIGPNNVGKTTVLKAYELFRNSGEAQDIESFYQNNEKNTIEIVGIFNNISEEDISPIGTKWIYTNEDGEKVIKYKWVWVSPGIKGEKYSWNEEEQKWILGGMGGWDTKIASCIPIPLIISPFEDSTQLEKQIVEILTSAIKENIKTDNTKLSVMINELNFVANNVKSEISDELSKTTGKLEENLKNIFPDHKIDLQAQAGKFDIDKILAAGTHLRVADAMGTFYPLANQGSGLQRAFLWSAIEALADTGNIKVNKKALKTDDTRILLIEEPESFLHPPAIRAAREALYKIAELDNWQVMLTTHSPVFIDVSKPHTTIVRVEKSNSTSTKTFSTDKADFDTDERERLQMIRNCHPTINEFFFSDQVVLVEGDTEEAVFNTLKPESVTVLNCRGKANIPMFQKILNHFGIGYIVIHDLDSPKAKRDGKWIKNSMWTINEKIFLESEKGNNNKVIVSIPDFEKQFFGYLQSGDKPYNAITEIKKSSRKEVVEELKNILDKSKIDTFVRKVNKKEQYSKFGNDYCDSNGISKTDQWDFNISSNEVAKGEVM